MIRVILTTISAIALTSCVSSVGSTLDGVPAWFSERQEDLSHEGYPSLQTANALSIEDSETPWDDIRSDLVEAQAEMDANDPGPVSITAAEMRAWAAEQISLVDKGEEPY